MNIPLTSFVRVCRRSVSNIMTKPFCPCWHTKKTGTGSCDCSDEDVDIKEWGWAEPCKSDSDKVILSDNNHHVMFHPHATSHQRTAFVRGDTPLKLNYNYYWEVKLLVKPVGNDIMVGVGTEKFNPAQYTDRNISLLGIDDQSYGLCYNGAVQHDSMYINRETQRFRDGSVVGIRLNMWQGTLEFFVNRKCQGTSFYNLRRHETAFYPMLSSATYKSSFKLVYASSWKASLFVDSLRMVTASQNWQNGTTTLPSGLRVELKRNFWINMSQVKESSMKRHPYVSQIKIKRLQITPSQRYTSAPNKLKWAFRSSYIHT